MKERFKQLPEPLQQQVIQRFAVAIVFVLLFFIALFGFWDVYLFLHLFALCRILYCKCLTAVLYLYQGRLYFGKRYLCPGGNDCDTKAHKKSDA